MVPATHPASPSLRWVCPLVQARAGCWNSGFRGQTQGENAVAVQKQPKGGFLECRPQLGVFTEETQNHTQKQSPIVKWCVKGGEEAVITASFPKHQSLPQCGLPENLPQPPPWGHSHHLCGSSHTPATTLSQLWEQMPVGCPLTEVGLKPQVSPRAPHDLKAGLKSLPDGCKFILQHQLCRFNICKTSKWTMGGCHRACAWGSWAGPESELPHELPQWVQVQDYYSPGFSIPDRSCFSRLV